jgi:hypothetical protein
MMEQARASKNDPTELPNHDPQLMRRFYCRYVRLQPRIETLGRICISILRSGPELGIWRQG